MRVLKLCLIGLTSLIGSMIILLELFGMDANHQTGISRMYEAHGVWKLLMVFGVLLWVGYIYATQCLFLKDETFNSLLEIYRDEEWAEDLED